MDSTIKLLCIFAAIFIISWLYNQSPYNRDGTDQQGWFKKRSGMRLYTDYATGNQYLKGGLLGGLQPRLGATGKIVNIYKE